MSVKFSLAVMEAIKAVILDRMSSLVTEQTQNYLSFLYCIL